MMQLAFLFSCVLARLMPLALLFPGVGGRFVSLRIRLALTLVLTLWVSSLHVASARLKPSSVAELGVGLGYELLLGLGLALGVLVLMVGLQLAGSLVGQLSGLSLSDLGDPAAAWGATAIDRFFGLFTLAALLSVNGHRRIVAALLAGFEAVPPGARPPAVDVAPLLAELLTRSFQLGLRVAAPIGFSLLLATAVVGLMVRVIPQLNSIGLGLSINLAILLAMSCLSLGAVTWLFEQQVVEGLQLLTQALGGPTGPAHR
jgi:flagellar biosynthetic protein FliR